eukprot:1148596-Pelagomonas_calceolata.AAC.1
MRLVAVVVQQRCFHAAGGCRCSAADLCHKKKVEAVKKANSLYSQGPSTGASFAPPAQTHSCSTPTATPPSSLSTHLAAAAACPARRQAQPALSLEAAAH